MKKFYAVLALFSLALFFLSTVGVTARADEMKDWKELAAFHQSFTTFLSDGSATRDEKYVPAWKEWRDAFVPFSTKFMKQYGSTREELMRSFDGLEAPEGIHVYPWNLVDLLTLDIREHENKMASWLEREGDQFFRSWEMMIEPGDDKVELKASFAERALNKYTDAQIMDPDFNREKVSKAQKAFKETHEVYKKILKDLKWPGHNKDFQGPGNPDDLAAAALKLLRDMQAQGKRWSRPEYDDEHIPLAACVTGNRWEVSKKVPLTGEPTQYSLQFLVAFEGTKSSELAYAYSMHFYTDEMLGVKMEPPFYYCNSVQYAKYKMLMSNIPSKARVSSGTRSFSMMGVLFRLALSFLLIGGGIAVWNAPLRAKFPQVSKICDILAGKKQVIGLALVGVGVLAFLRSTFLFTPLADFLPQALAVLLGLSLASLKPFEGKTSNEKVKKVLSCLDTFGRSLSPRQVLLGQTALVLGLFHFLLGGLFLL